MVRFLDERKLLALCGITMGFTGELLGEEFYR